MPVTTKIQWCDSTVNPIMGCGGCELFPSPGEVLAAIADAVNAADPGVKATSGSIKGIFAKLVDDVFQHSENPHPSHKKAVNTTNIWHLRDRFKEVVGRKHGADAAKAADDAIRKAITCYAATLHLNKGAKILDREGNLPGRDKPRSVHPGHAPIFEQVTRFAGRSAGAAALPDLLGQANPMTPWKQRLPRMIFVSDMGDALSTKADFPFLKEDLMPAILSEAGQRHLWLWLTKRPGRMAEFADEIGGFPPNLCAMTTLTGPDPNSLQRLEDLKKVKAAVRGLSIEPLWDRIPPSKLKLKGIDWVIVGGESGSGLDLTRPFDLAWAEELRDHCRNHGVAFFLKQLGRNPCRDGKVLRLKDKHGGDWHEWDEPLRTREFPAAFHAYRKDEMVPSDELRPDSKPKNKSEEPEDLSVTPEDRAEFKRQHKIVETGVKAFWKVGLALAAIKEKNLWRAGGHKSWDAYCRSVAGMSRGHAHRLMGAAGFMEMLKTSPRGDVLPVTEAQVRPLLRLPDPEQQVEVWCTAVERSDGGQPSQPLVTQLVLETKNPDGPVEKPISRAQQRFDLVAKLKAVIAKRKSWDDVEKLLAELETLV
jgi:protein gp37